jgi:hypothetical protein
MTMLLLRAVCIMVLIMVLAGGGGRVRSEVLFQQEVLLDHSIWGENGRRDQQELEQYTYHDWEVVSVHESVYHFCFIHSIASEVCASLMDAVQRSMERDSPHLLSRHTQQPEGGGGETASLPSVSPQRRTVFHLLDMMQTSAADMDWILELFPASLQINLLPPPPAQPSSSSSSSAHTHPSPSPSLAPASPRTSSSAPSAAHPPLTSLSEGTPAPSPSPDPDILLVNVASNITLIKEYLDKYKILILIHLSDEWYGKKRSHALLTEVCKLYNSL